MPQRTNVEKTPIRPSDNGLERLRQKWKKNQQRANSAEEAVPLSPEEKQPLGGETHGANLAILRK